MRPLIRRAICSTSSFRSTLNIWVTSDQLPRRSRTKLAGHAPSVLAILGVIPQCCDLGHGMSAPVLAAILARKRSLAGFANTALHVCVAQLAIAAAGGKQSRVTAPFWSEGARNATVMWGRSLAVLRYRGSPGASVFTELKCSSNAAATSSRPR